MPAHAAHGLPGCLIDDAPLHAACTRIVAASPLVSIFFSRCFAFFHHAHRRRACCGRREQQRTTRRRKEAKASQYTRKEGREGGAIMSLVGLKLYISNLSTQVSSS